MQATLRGGLTGKARFNRHRNRVQRMRAQQMLDEFFDAEDYELPIRPVRLGGRAEFLPTLDGWSQENVTLETGDQLELTLQAVTDIRETQSNEVAELQLQIEQEACALAEKAVTETVTTPTVKIIPAPFRARPRTAFQPQSKRGANRPFEFKRFIYGCALGSAAAAAILLAVSIVVH